MATRKQKGSTRAGRQIIAGLTELVEAAQRGDDLSRRFTVRTVKLPDDPKPYDAAAVKATRDLLGASQALFARLIGVSAALVRAWEQGTRPPAPVARRLLDEINREPSRWRAMLKPQNAA
jgi:DNA-binding transcriptional regulator YiaG